MDSINTRRPALEIDYAGKKKRTAAAAPYENNKLLVPSS